MTSLAPHSSSPPLEQWIRRVQPDAVVHTQSSPGALLDTLDSLGCRVVTTHVSPQGFRALEGVGTTQVIQGVAPRILADLRPQLPAKTMLVMDGGGPWRTADEIFWLPRGHGVVAIRIADDEIATYAECQDQLLRWSPDHRWEVLDAHNGDRYLVVHPRPRVHVTFLIEEYTAEYGASGLSINLDNLVATLDQTGLATWNVVHYDRCFHEGRPLPMDELCKPSGIDKHVLVCTCHYHSRANPSVALLNEVRLQGTKVAFMWLDKQISQSTPDYYNVADLNVVLDGNDFELPNPWPIFTPKNPIYFNDPGISRDVDISLAGEVRYLTQRKAYSARLKAETRVPVTMFATSAADTGRALSIAEYARIYQRSRISLAMTKDNVRQLKGRVFEIIHCGALLMCDVNHHVRSYLTPGVHYVEYRDYEDLVEKARYYLDHEGERRAIARAGFEHVKAHYSHDVFWRSLLARLGACAAAHPPGPGLSHA